MSATSDPTTMKREDNPNLHMLYTKTAVGHLLLIDSMIKQASDCANMNMNGVILALEKERAVLVAENAAYADAQDIVALVRVAEALETAREDAIQEIMVDVPQDLTPGHE